MRPVAVLLAIVAIVAAACGSDSSAEPVPSDGSIAEAVNTGTASSDSVVPTTTTGASTTTTGAPTTSPTTPATTAPPAPEPPVTDAPATTLPPFPPFLSESPDPPDVWSVVLAGSADFDDPVLAQAIADAAAAGYDVGATDCDEGAAEAIGMSGDGVYTITVYLSSEADARAAAEAFAARDVPATVVLVHLFCLD